MMRENSSISGSWLLAFGKPVIHFSGNSAKRIDACMIKDFVKVRSSGLPR